MNTIFIGVGIVIGVVVAWFFFKQKYGASNVSKSEYEKLQRDLNNVVAELRAEVGKKSQIEEELNNAKIDTQNKETELRDFTGQLASLKSNFDMSKKIESKLQDDLTQANKLLENEQNKNLEAEKLVTRISIEKDRLSEDFSALQEEVANLKNEVKEKTAAFNDAHKKVATLEANNNALEKNQQRQKEEIEALGKKFNQEFENIANKILEEKTEKFTKTNKQSMETLLKPLGENLDSFKKKVEEVYNKEGRERFSLAKEVENLKGLNEKLSQEAHNLTLALKADPKAQGNWGEMILESILEQSGLTKEREYFLENYLKDDNGNFLLNEDGQKMRPDAIIKYPDNRKVIIDSKVSLVAYTNYLASEDKKEQDAYLKQHIKDVKNHIVGLSKRGYEKFDNSLDFVMMFIPNEPAYMIAVKEEPELWNFAYEKRIILISPTNLITALKLISNLWDREHQSKNAQEIVDRGEMLFHKFVSFAESFKSVGKGLDNARNAYDNATKQLSTGKGNLIRQAEQLKSLKIKPKKELPAEFIEGNQVNPIIL